MEVEVEVEDGVSKGYRWFMVRVGVGCYIGDIKIKDSKGA